MRVSVEPTVKTSEQLAEPVDRFEQSRAGSPEAVDEPVTSPYPSPVKSELTLTVMRPGEAVKFAAQLEFLVSVIVTMEVVLEQSPPQLPNS